MSTFELENFMTDGTVVFPLVIPLATLLVYRNSSAMWQASSSHARCEHVLMLEAVLDPSSGQDLESSGVHTRPHPRLCKERLLS